jgi:periplasmic divalent cation tolerance protein
MHIVILITASGRKEAEKIAAGLVEGKLAACVNIIGGVKSFFWWQGRLDSAREMLLVVKSRRSKLNAIVKKVKSLHSYEVPEIIALPIIGGEKKYLRWIDGSLEAKR